VADDGLTVPEIAALQDGDEVVITWSGGNGPFCYRVKWWADKPWAALHRDLDYLVEPIIFSREDVRCIHRVELAG